MVVFEERENRSTRRKPLGAEYRTNKLNPDMTPDLGIEPRATLVGAECSPGNVVITSSLLSL